MTTFATWGQALSCCKITLSCLSLYCGRLSFNARLKRINCVRSDTDRLWLFQSVLTVHNTLRRAGPTKYRAWPWSREYSVWPSTWKHCRELPMIFCAWDYRNEPIFRPQSHCDAEIPSVFAFQAAIYKQTNAVQHLSASIRTASNFLDSESFPWLWGVLKWLVESLPMIVPILLDFDTSLAQVMPPILHLRKPSLFHRYAGLRPAWSKSPFLKRWNHSRHVLSLIAASP